MDGLARLGEDIGVLRRREDAVEVGLAEALADGEDIFGGVGGGEGEFLRGDADDGAFWLVTVSWVERDDF